MKKLILLLGIVVAGYAVTAQQPQHGMDKSEKIEVLKEKLDLSDEQVDQMKALRKMHMEAMKAVKDDQSLSRADKIRKMADAVEAHDEKLSEILTEEQMAELKSMREQRKQKGKQRRMQRRKQEDDK